MTKTVTVIVNRRLSNYAGFMLKLSESYTTEASVFCTEVVKLATMWLTPQPCRH
jgi:hypothetical protein